MSRMTMQQIVEELGKEFSDIIQTPADEAIAIYEANNKKEPHFRLSDPEDAKVSIKELNLSNKTIAALEEFNILYIGELDIVAITHEVMPSDSVLLLAAQDLAVGDVPQDTETNIYKGKYDYRIILRSDSQVRVGCFYLGYDVYPYYDEYAADFKELPEPVTFVPNPNADTPINITGCNIMAFSEKVYLEINLALEHRALMKSINNGE